MRPAAKGGIGNVYVAYRVWQKPSWTNGPENRPRYERVIYGRGSTPEEAIWDARYYVGEDGQTRQRENAPNRGDLSTCREQEFHAEVRR
jgi:hypothetical protein